MLMREEQERAEAAWNECRAWVERLVPTGIDDGSAVHFLFRGVSQEGVRRAVREIRRRTEFCFTGSVWMVQECFDPKCTQVDECLRRLERGELAMFTIQYVVGNYDRPCKTLPMSVDVTREEGGRLDAHGQTFLGLVHPELATVKERFLKLIEHALWLERMLEARELHVGPTEEPGVEGGMGEEWRRV